MANGPAADCQGSRVAFVARFLGRRLAYTYEILEFTPGERLVMRTAQGPFPMETTYTWTAIDGVTTRMTLRNRGEPTGFSKLLAPIMAIRHAASEPQGPPQTADASRRYVIRRPGNGLGA